jgi:hypothetical protein
LGQPNTVLATAKGLGDGELLGLIAELEGTISRGRESHSDTTLYISVVILYTNYTGRRQNDFNAYA